MSEETDEARALSTFVNEKRKVPPSAYLRLGPDSYLYTNSGIPLGAGLYCANLRTETIRHLVGGWPNILNIVQSQDGRTLVLMKSQGGSKGIGFTRFSAVSVDANCNSQTNKLISYSWDMVSGMCARSEQLGIEESGEVLDYTVSLDAAGMPTITFSVKEQKCPDGEIVEKSITYTYDGHQFVPDA
jgi:hypothetical protein